MIQTVLIPGRGFIKEKQIAGRYPFDFYLFDYTVFYSDPGILF